MGLNSNGADRGKEYALVVYIPDPLGRFLDNLRLEIAPDCRPHAHVSVLPPRPVSSPWQEASEHVRRAVAGRFGPFEIEAGDLAIFPITNVIYLETARGGDELRRLHQGAGCGPLEFQEQFPYHPHITVAQELPLEYVQPAFEIASRRWKEYRGPRSFRAERLTFVQSTDRDCWTDLVEVELDGVPVSR